MESEESSNEFIGGLSTKALVFGIVYVAVISIFNYVASYRWVSWHGIRVPGWQYFTPVTAWGQMAVQLVFWLFIVTLLNSALRFKGQELAVIYVMTVIAQLISSNNFGFASWFAWIGFEIPISHAPQMPLETVVDWIKANSQYAQYLWLDPVYDPNIEGNIASTVWGTGVIRWDLFAPLVNWRLLVFVSFFFFQLFLFLLVRRRMIQEEMLPFPLASAPVHLIESAAGSSTPRIKGIFRNKYLWIGILLGTVMQAGYWYAGIIQTYHVPWKDFQYTVMWAAHSDARIPIFMVIQYGVPWVWAIGLLTPVEVSATFVGVWAVIGLLVPGLVISQGLFEPSWSSGWFNISQDYFDYGGGWDESMAADWLSRYGWTPIAFAGYVWIVVWMLIGGRRSIVASIKGIMTPNPEIDKDEAFPYRWLYIGLALSLVAHLAAAAMIGAILWLVLSGLILQAVVWIGFTRVRGEGGAFGTPGAPPNWSHSAYGGALDEILYVNGNLWASTGKWAYGTWSSYATDWLAPMGYVHIGPTVYSDGHANFLGNPAWYTLELFKVGDMTKTKPRSIFYGIVIALIVSLAVTVPTVMHGNFVIGRAGYTMQDGRPGRYNMGPTERIYGLNPAYNAYFASGGEILGYQYGPYEGVRLIGDGEYIWYILIWVVVFAALTMVRTRYPRFIFNPVGLIMASWVGMAPSFFFAMLVTLAVRIIATRYIGVRTYGEVLLPIATGLLVAQGLYYVVDMSVMSVVAYLWGWPTG